MSHAAPEEPTTPIGKWATGFVISLLRTFVPAVWGVVLGWVLINIPQLAQLLGLQEGDPAPSWLIPFVMLGWYAVWRKLEPKLPAWLTRFVLGANTAPTYTAPATETSLSQPIPQDPVEPGDTS